MSLAALQQPLLLEVHDGQDRGEDDHEHDEDEGPAVVGGGEADVHAVDAGDEGRGHEEHAGDGEYLDDLILLDVDEAERGLQQEGHLLRLLVGVVVHALDVAHDAAELRGEIAPHPGGGVVEEVLQHAADAEQAFTHVGDEGTAAAQELDDIAEVFFHGCVCFVGVETEDVAADFFHVGLDALEGVGDAGDDEF